MTTFLSPTDLAARTYPEGLRAALDMMNEAQLQVACLENGLAAVLGVAGSGKTRALVNLLARVVADGFDPQSILAMTFTRNAALEMNQRLESLGIVGARVGTIHSVARQLIAQETSLIEGVSMDEKNRMSIELLKLLGDLRRQRKLKRHGVDKQAIEKFISACKARGCGTIHQDPLGINMQLSDGLYDEASVWARKAGVDSRQLADIYLELERRRHSRGLYGFDDMILWAWMSLLALPAVRQRWQQKFQIIIVDEVQDSNPVQWDIARLLAGLESCIVRRAGTAQPTPNSGYIAVRPELYPTSEGMEGNNPNSLYVFGDPAQSIYKFRCAVPQLFVEFTQREDVTSIPLPYNYRSTPGICEAGSAIVRGKPWHLTGDMIPRGPYADRDMVSSLPGIAGFNYPEEESSAAVRWAMEHAESAPEGLRSCAILSRTTVALHLAEVECIRARIPYRKMAAGSFFESKEVKDIMSYVRVACGLDADGSALRRIINTPFRFIGRPFLDKCESFARNSGVSLLDAMMAKLDDVSPRQAETIEDFTGLLQSLNRLSVHAEECYQKTKVEAVPNAPEEDPPEGNFDFANKGPAHVIGTMLDETGYIDALRSEEGLGEDDTRLACIGELQRMAELFLSPMEFVKYVDGIAAAVRAAGQAGLKKKAGGDAEQALTLSTIHRAKGLEWDYVRVVDCVNGRFPHKMAEDQDEELRLFYVAVTRAKQECIVSHPCGEDHDGAKVSPYVLLLQHIRETVTTSGDR